MYKVPRVAICRKIFSGLQFVRPASTISTLNKTEEHLKPWQQIPGPLSLPIIGQLLHFLPGGWLYKRTMELQELLYKNYGPIVRLDGNLGIKPIIFIFDPEAAINLLRKEEPIPTRLGFDSLAYFRKHYYNNNSYDLNGLILEQGENWRKFRTIVNPVMLQPKTIKQYTNIMSEVADDMIKRMKLIRNKENMLEGNLLVEMNLWALESIGVVALGGRLNCFDPNLPEDSPVKKLINLLHDVLQATEKLDFQPSLWKYFATPQFKKGMKTFSEYMKLNEFFIDKAVDELKFKGERDNKDRSVLEKLLDIDRNVAIVMGYDMVFGGTDTVASTTLGVLYFLAVNPEKQTKLREETMLKKDKNAYIKACIKETLRLFPILDGNFRHTTKEHDVLGYRIPKDVCVIFGNSTFCLMEEQYPRASEFLPERWIVDKSDPLYHGNAHPFAYAPFGYGVRSCIGRRVAYLEMETFVPKVVENFEIEWFGPPPKRVRTSTVNYFLEPYNFIFKDV